MPLEVLIVGAGGFHNWINHKLGESFAEHQKDHTVLEKGRQLGSGDRVTSTRGMLQASI